MLKDGPLATSRILALLLTAPGELDAVAWECKIHSAPEAAIDVERIMFTFRGGRLHEVMLEIDVEEMNSGSWARASELRRMIRKKLDEARVTVLREADGAFVGQIRLPGGKVITVDWPALRDKAEWAIKLGCDVGVEGPIKANASLGLVVPGMGVLFGTSPAQFADTHAAKVDCEQWRLLMSTPLNIQIPDVGTVKLTHARADIDRQWKVCKELVLTTMTPEASYAQQEAIWKKVTSLGETEIRKGPVTRATVLLAGKGDPSRPLIRVAWDAAPWRKQTASISVLWYPGGATPGTDTAPSAQ